MNEPALAVELDLRSSMASWKPLDIDPDDAVWVSGAVLDKEGVKSEHKNRHGSYNPYEDSEVRFRLRFRHGLE